MKLRLYILTFIVISCSLSYSFCQDLPAATGQKENLLLGEVQLLGENDSLTGFLIESGLIEAIEETPNVQNIHMQKLHKLSESNRKANSKEGIKKFHNTSYVALENMYVQGDTLFSELDNKLITSVSGGIAFELGTIPLAANTRVVFDKSEYINDLTFFSVKLDQQSWLEEIHSDIFSKYSSEDILLQNTLNLSERALEMLKNEYRFMLLKELKCSDRYSALKSVVGSDSLVLSDELVDRDSLELISNLNKIDSLYVQCLKNRNEYTKSERDELKEKAKLHHEKLNKIKDSRSLSLQDVSALKPNISFVDKLMFYTKNLDIGVYSPQYSELTINYAALRGIRYEWANSSFFGAVGYGKQFTYMPFLLRLRNDDVSIPQQRYSFARVGIGSESGTNLAVTALDVKEQGDSIFTKRNQVISISNNVDLFDGCNVETELALSKYAPLGQQIDNNLTNGAIEKQNTAFQTKIQYDITSLGLGIGVGYFYYGPRFKTLGNPFLLTNNQGLLANLSASYNRLLLSIDYKFGSVIDPGDLEGNSGKNWQLNGMLTYQTKNNHRFSLMVAPNTFRYAGLGNYNTSSSSTLYTLQSLFLHKLKNEKTLISTISLTNYNSNFRLQDTLTTNQTGYVFVQEVLQNSNGNSFIGSFSAGGNMQEEKLHLQQISAQIGYQMKHKKIRNSWTFEFFKDTYNPYWIAGLIGRLDYSISKVFSIGGSVDYRKNMNDLKQFFDPDQLWIQSNISIKI